MGGDDGPDRAGPPKQHHAGIRNSQLRFLGFLLGAYAGLLAPAWSAEKVTIPAYAPAPGVEHVYRVQMASETDMSFWFDNPGASSVAMRGAYRRRMIILSRDEKSMRVRWSLDSALPEGVSGAASTYQLNPLYQNSLLAYGVNQLEFETNLSGIPSNVLGADAIVANMQKMAANGPGGISAAPESGVSNIIEAVRANPLQIVTALIPEALVLANGQGASEETLEIAQAYTSSGTENISGVDVRAEIIWTLESTDTVRHTATLSFSQIDDPIALSQSQQAATAKMMTAFPERAKALTSDQLAEVKRASKNRTSRFVVSLDDGSVLEALETVAVRSGGMTVRTFTHVRREQVPASLPIPAILTSATLLTPDLRVEPLPSTTATPARVNDDIQASAPPGGTSQAHVAAAGNENKNTVIAPISLQVKSAILGASPVHHDIGLNIDLTPDSAAKFKDFTQAAMGQQTQVLIDDKVIMEPWIREPIVDGHIVITDADRKNLEILAERLAVPGASIFVRVVP